MTVAHQVGIPAAREGLRLFISLGFQSCWLKKERLPSIMGNRNPCPLGSQSGDKAGSPPRL